MAAEGSLTVLKKRKYSELEDDTLPSGIELSGQGSFAVLEDSEDEVIAENRPLKTAGNFKLKSPSSTPSIHGGTEEPPGKHAQENPAKKAHNELSVTERKRIVVWKRPEKVATAMQNWVTQTYDLLDPFRDDDECWLHPDPQSTITLQSGVQRARGHISKNFTWTDDKGSHSLRVNFGIVAKLVSRKITRRQKDGFITQKWHLSHLCGNWTCLNPNHTTVEKGSINAARNNCFSHRGGCLHRPPCMKEKKLNLGPNGQVQVQTAAPFCFENYAFPSEESQIPFHCEEEDSDVYHPFFSEMGESVEEVDEDSFYGYDGLNVSGD